MDVILRATRNESGERSGVSPPVSRFRGSSTVEVRGDIGVSNMLALIDDVSAAAEPVRLAHISLVVLGYRHHQGREGD